MRVTQQPRTAITTAICRQIENLARLGYTRRNRPCRDKRSAQLRANRPTTETSVTSARAPRPSGGGPIATAHLRAGCRHWNQAAEPTATACVLAIGQRDTYARNPRVIETVGLSTLSPGLAKRSKVDWPRRIANEYVRTATVVVEIGIRSRVSPAGDARARRRVARHRDAGGQTNRVSASPTRATLGKRTLCANQQHQCQQQPEQ